MKIRMIKPLPRLDHVIPAGQVIDCPEGFARKMIRSGRAVWADEDGENHDADTMETVVPEKTTEKPGKHDEAAPVAANQPDVSETATGTPGEPGSEGETSPELKPQGLRSRKPARTTQRSDT